MINNVDKLPFTDHVKNRIASIIEYALQYSQIDTIALFGSYARGTYTMGSDLDILILSEYPLDRDCRGDIASYCDDLYADAIFYTHKQLQDSGSVFTQEIRRDSILLWRR